MTLAKGGFPQVEGNITMETIDDEEKVRMTQVFLGEALQALSWLDGTS
ncbi:MAG: hypothetical protein V7L31_29130 [Nostoc sp.]